MPVTVTLVGSHRQFETTSSRPCGETTTCASTSGSDVFTAGTMPAAPDAGASDGLVVQFPHTVEGYAERIDKCTIITTYGVGSNDRVVLSGNPDCPNLDWMSGLNDPTYMPDLGYAAVGSGATPIRGYCRIGSSLGIVKADDGSDSTVFLRSAALSEDGEAVFTLQQTIAGVGAVRGASLRSSTIPSFSPAPAPRRSQAAA